MVPTFEQARDLLMGLVSPVAARPCPLDKAYGRILFEDLTADADVPPFDRSPYDGYALRSADTGGASRQMPVALRILEEVPAGAVPTQALVPFTCTKVLTGAPLPPGADCVVMFEKTEFTKRDIRVFSPLRPMENVVRQGEDVQKGAVLAHKGTAIDAGIAGTLCALGQDKPLVYEKLRVGIVSTGDEVVEAGDALSPGKIRNANRYMLTCALEKAGFEAVYLGHARDDVGQIAALLEQGLAACHAVVSTGGVSVGDYDLTLPAMEKVGADIHVNGVALKPGMACVYGMKDGRLLCGLSGNPASALTNFVCIALPALKKMAGCAQPHHRLLDVTVRGGFDKPSRGTRVLRGRLQFENGQAVMLLPPEQGNVVLSSAILCDVMALVPAGSGPLAPGSRLKGWTI